MLHSPLSSIFTTSATITVTVGQYFLCLAAALGLGLVIALVARYKNRQSASLTVALVLLPVIVQTIIMLVNKEFGAGLAVAGAFSLMRFRSAPASARDMVLIALAVAVGLACGMGVLGIAVILTVLVLAALFLMGIFGFSKVGENERVLRIVIPESLDYDDVFSDLFRKYTKKSELLRVKTTNMGSLYKLKYAITLKDPSKEKAFIDELRVRNGNLEISCTRPEAESRERL